MPAKPIRIGGACGFWGEANHAVAQLLTVEGLDFLAHDYLAEITLSIMARARAKDPSAGWAPDFVSAAMAPNLARIAEKGVRVVSNAGGLNPAACAAALRKVIAEQGLSLKVAAVEGDDLTARADAFAAQTDLGSGAPFPDPAAVASINAYLGAFPIAAALDAGADIVVTGRCADSALVLGPCLHAHGWSASDLDLLAAGSLAGHLIECGPQSTGGNFTDWEQAGDVAQIGYPVAEIAADGTTEIFKPDHTTGLVSPATVGEQLVYEIGDPRAYLLPDVAADFSNVRLTRIAPDRVRVEGAQGRAPSGKLKVSATYADGWRAGQVLGFEGRAARAKARAFAEAAFARTRAALGNAPDFAETSVEILGGDGPSGECTLKLAARHDDPKPVGLFLRETIGLALATPPGLTLFGAGGRPKPSPVVRLFSFLAETADVPVKITLDGAEIPYAPPTPPPPEPLPEPHPEPLAPIAAGPMTAVPLEALAWARSGDKGDAANIGVLARDPDHLPWIWKALTPAAVSARFDGRVEGAVERFPLPGVHGLNLLLHGALGGGGIASLRWDAQGKAYAQRLLGLPVPIPRDLAP
ncbi:MAG: acyclic terpene utilization AtuA family protein [Pseudomonadota bacterium]